MPNFQTRGRAKIVRRRAKKKIFQQARLIDDEFFKVCFGRNIEATQVLVDIILGIPGLKVVSVVVQEHISLLQSKTVVLDLLATTETGEEVDIEIQRTAEPFLTRRARYYLSIMTTRMLKEGDDYDKLRDAYVLFICEDDPFKEGKPIYSFAMRGKDDDGKYLGDGSCVCFFNCAYRGDDAAGKLAKDMTESNWKNITDPTLQSLVKRGKIKPEGKIVSYKAEAEFARGYLQGRDDGQKQTRDENFAVLLRLGVLSPEQIAEAFQVPLEEVLEIQKTIKA